MRKSIKVVLIICLIFNMFLMFACTNQNDDQVVITFDTVGGLPVDSIYAKKGETIMLPTPTKEGYVFLGWVYDTESIDEYYQISLVVTKSMTLYAVWEQVANITTEPYRLAMKTVDDLNPLNQNFEDLSDLASIIYDSLYIGDFDWDEAIRMGVASHVNDFANTEALPHRYFPRMAETLPVDLDNHGLKWQIQLKTNLSFHDGTIIDAETFIYTYQQLLNPLLKNQNAFIFYDEDYLNVVNAKAYYEQTNEDYVSNLVPFESVGIELVDDFTFNLILNEAKTQWEVTEMLSDAITSVVHPVKFEESKNEEGTSSNYGVDEHTLMTYGPYEIHEWVSDSHIHLVKDETHYASEQYAIENISFIMLEDLNEALTLFNNDELDFTLLSNFQLAQMHNHENIKLRSDSNVFRLAFSIDRPTKVNPIMQYETFRQAIYFAIDRELLIETIYNQNIPVQGFLSLIHYANHENTVTYRQTTQGQDVLNDFYPSSYGFNPVLAKTLFDQAYAEAILDGVIEINDVVELEFTYADGARFEAFANFLKTHLESIFGSNFEFVKNPLPGELLTDPLDGIYHTGDFDMIMTAWGGVTNDAPLLLQVFSSDKGSLFMYEKGFTTGTVILNVDLEYTKIAVQEWIQELEASDILLVEQLEMLDLFNEFMNRFENNIYEGTYDELIFEVYHIIMGYQSYEGKSIDANHLVAALEAELLKQMIAIPLFSNVNGLVFSNRVNVLLDSDHARMAYNDFRYIDLN
jgi:oligopeptide transport system substrate-binding protein